MTPSQSRRRRRRRGRALLAGSRLIRRVDPRCSSTRGPAAGPGLGSPRRQRSRDRRRGVRPGSEPHDAGRRGCRGRRGRAGRCRGRWVAGDGRGRRDRARPPFVCVPAGTRNHFARDLGLDPADPTAALDALSDGLEGRIDVGEVNGSVFFNNVSLGIYAEAIHHAGYRDAKVRTLVETARTVLGPGAEISGAESRRRPRRRATSIQRSCSCSNNPYALRGPPSRGGRPTLSGGRLGIIVIDRPARGRRPAGRAWSSASLRVDAPDPVHAGIDGEAVELTAPLEFAIRPAALRIRAPRRVAVRRRQRSSAATASGASATPLTDPRSHRAGSAPRCGRASRPRARRAR